MRIAIFTDSFLPGVGGTENAVLGLATALAKHHEVAVCAPTYNKKYKDEFPFKVFRTKSFKVSDNDICALPGISGKFKKQVKEFKPDIIHCQTPMPISKYAIKFAKKNNVPIIMTVHTKFKTALERSCKSKTIVNAFLKNMGKKLKKVQGVYLVSHDLKDEIKLYGYNGEAHVVKNGANFTRVENVDKNKLLAYEKYGLSEKDNILLYVGHIVKFKNLQFTIDALKLVKEAGIDFKMIFVGHGLDDQYFKDYCAKQGIGDNVIFTGQITDKKLLGSLYSAADLFPFPSIFDNDPLTIVEAALNHTPSITLKGTGSSERIENEVSGFIVEHDVKIFADKIIELLANKKRIKEVGDKAEQMIPKNWEDTAAEYLKEYKKYVK